MRDKFPQPVAIKTIGDSFDEVVLPHLDSAYRLARSLMRNDEDAKDVVHETAVPSSSESFVTRVTAGVVTAAT